MTYVHLLNSSLELILFKTHCERAIHQMSEIVIRIRKNCKTSMQYGIDIFWTPKKQFRMTTWKLMYTKTSTHKLIVSEIFFLEWKLNVDKGKYEVLELWDNRISFERNNHANFGLSCLQFDPVELSKIQSYLLFCVEMVTTLFSKLD